MKLLFDQAQWMMNTDSAWLMLRTDLREATKVCDEMKDGKVYVAEVKEYRQRRSLDANAFAWVVIDKIASKINIGKEEIYRRAIKDIGGSNTIVCVKDEAVEALCDGWSRQGLGWQTDTFPSKIDGCTNVVLYYGSSTYDTATMSRLIDYLVQDAKSLGIEVTSEAEIALLLDGWHE